MDTAITTIEIASSTTASETAARTRSSISRQNSSNSNFFNRHNDRRSSLLAHPDGLKLIKKYAEDLQKELPQGLGNLATALKQRLETCLTAKETIISSTLRGVLKDVWAKDPFEVTGEQEEQAEGTLNNETVSGYPDIVVRKNGFVLLIIEVSVDESGGERKVGQAFDYASLLSQPKKTSEGNDESSEQEKAVMLFSLHFDRRKSSNINSKITVTEEAFLYCHHETEDERKFGFLWREVYTDNLAAACAGIVRCVDCSTSLGRRTAGDLQSPTLGQHHERSHPNVDWQVASDNVAISNKDIVYKIFDNRFHPTHRRPDVWLNKKLSWMKDLHVAEELRFEESVDLDRLGKSSKRQKVESGWERVPYPKGSVLVIRYKYLEGTHFAWKASHFEQIANCIASMHKDGIIHGDVRGFNMLHPHPEPKEGGIDQSRLIDFDFSGPSGSVYPPGYSKRVPENLYDRIGKPWGEMKEHHDCYELASAMAKYQISVKMNGRDVFDLDLTDDWIKLCKSIRSTESATDVARMIRDFIKQFGDGDVDIALAKAEQEIYEGLLKGTGSPNKSKQRPRRSTSGSKV
eukprot:scaffold9316_cov90-Cylindrotheca_fusiformis.AAC.1